jgi:hypothetical protein
LIFPFGASLDRSGGYGSLPVEVFAPAGSMANRYTAHFREQPVRVRALSPTVGLYARASPEYVHLDVLILFCLPVALGMHHETRTSAKPGVWG